MKINTLHNDDVMCYNGNLRHVNVFNSLPNISQVHLCMEKPHGLKRGARPITMATRKMNRTAPSRTVSNIKAMERLPR